MQVTMIGIDNQCVAVYIMEFCYFFLQLYVLSDATYLRHTFLCTNECHTYIKHRVYNRVQYKIAVLSQWKIYIDKVT